MAWLKMGRITTKHHIWIIGVELLNTINYQNFHWAADFQVTRGWPLINYILFCGPYEKFKYIR